MQRAKVRGPRASSPRRITSASSGRGQGNPGVNEAKTKAGAQKRASLRERLLDAAEQTIQTRGLAALKARELATQAGCALGAIYTAFSDLDELILSVNLRTLERLDATLAEATASGAPGQALSLLARAYLVFARRNQPGWRALFEHRLAPGTVLPDWFAQALDRLFSRLEAPLAELLPDSDATQRASLARTLFSAVHGVIVLGLEEKVAETPPEALDAQVDQLVRLIAAGLEGGALRDRA